MVNQQSDGDLLPLVLGYLHIQTVYCRALDFIPIFIDGYSGLSSRRGSPKWHIWWWVLPSIYNQLPVMNIISIVYGKPVLCLHLPVTLLRFFYLHRPLSYFSCSHPSIRMAKNCPTSGLVHIQDAVAFCGCMGIRALIVLSSVAARSALRKAKCFCGNCDIYSIPGNSFSAPRTPYLVNLRRLYQGVLQFHVLN